MTRKVQYIRCLSIIILFLFGIKLQTGIAQSSNVRIKGTVHESGTNLPLKLVSISVYSTGESSETDENGAFVINAPSNTSEIIVDLPGYIKRNIFLNGKDSINVYMVPVRYKSFDNTYNSPLGTFIMNDASQSITAIKSDELKYSISTSYDQNLEGRVAGMRIIDQSGMPGHKTFINMRGYSSLFGRNDPLLIIDGMIYEHNYADKSLIEGFSLNPMDIIDIDDISDITVQKNGDSYLGGISGNGLININTEQKSEASSEIKFSLSSGISTVPKKLDLLNASEFKNYFTQRLTEEGYTTSDINSSLPWLNGNSGAKDYYRYNNSTDWQDEIFQNGIFQKYHVFLKGGDDIATYNISSGYLKQEGLYEKSKYTRFNLRINGKINITDRFSVTPNAKLSLADSYLPNQGPSVFKNPIISALLIPPITAVYAKDATNGTPLPYLDDVTVFNVSNPVAIVQNATGTNRNYHFLSSVNLQYKFNEHFLISNLIGINFNNSRENIFLPDIGLVQVDLAANSPQDFTNEFRSTQNHTTFTYTNKTNDGQSFDVNAGLRFMENSYKFNKVIDLNTPSDDFKSLGQGSKYSFLRSSTGDDRGLLWLSYFASGNYNYMKKYYLNVNLSYEGNSAVNKKNRYALLPSIGAAWRLSSEDFMSSSGWIEDLKLRASYSYTGNIYNNTYDFSKLYYTDARINSIGVITREGIPNENLELEKKTTLNVGIDLTLFRQIANVKLDYYIASINNLIVEQKLPSNFGYTDYYDNGGKMQNTGIELYADYRMNLDQITLTLGGNITKENNEIKNLAFLNASSKNIVTQVEGAEYVTSVNNPMNSFWGYKTNGILGSNSAYIGPKGVQMSAGDVNYVDQNNDGKINDEDKSIIGNPNPDIFGGLFAKLAYKHFEIIANFNYCYGNDVFNYVRYNAESMSRYDNQFKTVLNRGTSLPRTKIGDITGDNEFSDRWIEDGSYFRLKQLTVNYTLPETQYYKGITIYITATNLLTFTKYSGYDPEFMYTNNPFYMGIDYGMMPQVRSFILGLKLDL